MGEKDVATGIRPSIRMEELLREAGTQPFTTFDLHPLAEVRDQCVRTLEKNGWDVFVGRLPADMESVSDWAEGRIRILRRLNDPLWRKLLEWYVFHAGTYRRSNLEEKTAVRAIEFAITLAREESLELAEAVHAVSSRLRRDNNLYWHAPSMNSFLAWLLSTEVARAYHLAAKDPAIGWYVGWASAERAIRRIVDAEDITFLPRLESLAGVENWEVLGGSDPFGLAIQSAIIAHAVKTLREAREKQSSDLNSTVGAWLRKEGGLQGSVSVSVHYPERVAVGARLTLIRVLFTTTRADEKELLSQILSRLEVFWEGEGFDPAGRVRGEITIDAASGVGGVEMTVASRGHKRFWINFYGNGKPSSGRGATEIATMAGYVTVE